MPELPRAVEVIERHWATRVLSLVSTFAFTGAIVLGTLREATKFSRPIEAIAAGAAGVLAGVFVWAYLHRSGLAEERQFKTAIWAIRVDLLSAEKMFLSAIEDERTPLGMNIGDRFSRHQDAIGPRSQIHQPLADALSRISTLNDAIGNRLINADELKDSINAIRGAIQALDVEIGQAQTRFPELPN